MLSYKLIRNFLDFFYGYGTKFLLTRDFVLSMSVFTIHDSIKSFFEVNGCFDVGLSFSRLYSEYKYSYPNA